MIPACCCVPPTCEIFLNDTTLSNFTQVDGTWTKPASDIETTSATGMLIHDTPHPDSLPYGRVTIDGITLPRAGARVRMLLAWLDADNYLFQEFEVMNPGSVVVMVIVVRFGYRQGGTDTFPPPEAGTNGNSNPSNTGLDEPDLCYNGQRLTSMHGFLVGTLVGGGLDYALPEAGLTLGTKVGVEVLDNLGTVRVSGFSFHGRDDETCVFCNGACGCRRAEGMTTATSATVYLSGVANGTCGSCVATYDDTTFVIDEVLASSDANEFNTKGGCGLKKAAGSCDAHPPFNLLRMFTGGAGASVSLFIDGAHGQFTFTVTDCDDTLVDTAGTNTSGTPRCDWTGCTATVTLDYTE